MQIKSKAILGTIHDVYCLLFIVRVFCQIDYVYAVHMAEAAIIGVYLHELI